MRTEHDEAAAIRAAILRSLATAEHRRNRLGAAAPDAPQSTTSNARRLRRTDRGRGHAAAELARARARAEIRDAQ